MARDYNRYYEDYTKDWSDVPAIDLGNYNRFQPHVWLSVHWLETQGISNARWRHQLRRQDKLRDKILTLATPEESLEYGCSPRRSFTYAGVLYLRLDIWLELVRELCLRRPYPQPLRQRWQANLSENDRQRLRHKN